MSHQSTWKDAVFYFILWETWWRAKELIKGQEKFHALSLLEGGGEKKGASGWEHEIEQWTSNVYDAFSHLPIKKKKRSRQMKNNSWGWKPEEHREGQISDREKEKVRVGSLRPDQPPAPVWISPFFTVCTHPSETHSPCWQMDWC